MLQYKNIKKTIEDQSKNCKVKSKSGKLCYRSSGSCRNHDIYDNTVVVVVVVVLVVVEAVAAVEVVGLVVLVVVLVV